MIFKKKMSWSFFFLICLEPPYFLVEPHSTHVVKRGFAILPCLAASPGGEVTHLQWFHDHTPLAGQGVKHLVLKNGSLMLSNLYPAQAGNYSCQASNKYGRSLTSATLTVSSKLVFVFHFLVDCLFFSPRV